MPIPLEIEWKVSAFKRIAEKVCIKRDLSHGEINQMARNIELIFLRNLEEGKSYDESMHLISLMLETTDKDE